MGIAKRHVHMIYEDEDGKRRVSDTSATDSKPFAKIKAANGGVATVMVRSRRPIAARFRAPQSP